MDKCSEQDVEVPYSDFRTSILYVYMTVIGDFNFDSFECRDFAVSWIFFIITTLFVSIVLLNMLIALMGSTFNRITDI